MAPATQCVVLGSAAASMVTAVTRWSTAVQGARRGSVVGPVHPRPPRPTPVRAGPGPLGPCPPTPPTAGPQVGAGRVRVVSAAARMGTAVPPVSTVGRGVRPCSGPALGTPPPRRPPGAHPAAPQAWPPRLSQPTPLLLLLATCRPRLRLQGRRQSARTLLSQCLLSRALACRLLSALVRPVPRRMQVVQALVVL